MKKYECDELQKVVEICKENNIKVYAFQKDTPIGQIFIVDAEGHIGSVSESWGMVSYSTVHHGCKDAGTGFGLTDYNGYESASIKRIKDAMLTIRPQWAHQYDVKKYKDWNDYLSKPINQILTYFEL